MNAESLSSRYGGRPATALLILVLTAAGGCGSAEREAPAATAGPVTQVSTTATLVTTTPGPETTLGTQPAATPATRPTSVPVATEPSSVATTTQAPTTTTEETVTRGTAPSPTIADEGGTTTTQTPPVTVASTTATEPTTTTTRAPTTTAAPPTTDASTTTTTTTTTTEPAVDGSAVYSLNCVACHNDSGEGGTGADLRQSTLAPAEITSVIVNGRGKLMPGWGDILTAAEIEAVALYVKALQEG